jgi:hypothetical protein
MKSKKFTTLRELQAEIPAIIKEHGNNNDIARAALVNPILALEMSGYELSDELKHELDYHIRFGAEKKKELLRLEKEVHKAAGKSFDLRDDKALKKIIHPLIAKKGNVELKKQVQYSFSLRTGKAGATFKKEQSDPYEAYRDAHPAMAPLLAYRKIESSVAPLGSEKLFKRVLKGDTGEAVTFNRVRFSLKNSESFPGSNSK